MKLSDFLEEIAYAELSDLSYAKGGVINDENQPKVIIKLNDTLTSLYTKYVMHTVDAWINTEAKALRYDLDDPNSVRIIYVVPTEQDHADIYRNRDYLSLRGNSLVFLAPPKGNSFAITYQWKPTKLRIIPTQPNFLDQEIQIPEIILPLVRTLVASGLFTDMNGELHKNTGTQLFNKAQYMQAELEMSGILNISVPYRNDQFVISGFK